MSDQAGVLEVVIRRKGSDNDFEAVFEAPIGFEVMEPVSEEGFAAGAARMFAAHPGAQVGILVVVPKGEVR